MRKLKYTVFLLMTAGMLQCRNNPTEQAAAGRTYYLSLAGDDKNAGGKDAPWRTIGRLNEAQLHAGDTVYLAGGQTFEGLLHIDSSDSGSPEHAVVITSSGTGSAVIDGRNGQAMMIYNAQYIRVQNLQLKGAGRKDGNTESGLVLTDSRYIALDSLDISGFQKSGLLIYASANVEAKQVYAHDNGFAGIEISGAYQQKNCHHITVIDCRAENNPGDPTNLTNHSGNGIIAGNCSQVMISGCTATNNGWDMPRKGNGPVGIWAYEADSVVIQHCLSYQNKTSAGGEDGGGFDLDGGVTHSVIQYCLSYGNQGSGFGIFQYSGASPWHDNVIRYNISENDGYVSTAKAGVYIWNNSDDSSQFNDCFFYNNVIYNAKGSAISFAGQSARKDFRFYNNIFVAGNGLLKGKSSGDTFTGNDWWSLPGGFNIGGIRSFRDWVAATGQEMYKGHAAGLNIAPAFRDPGGSSFTAAAQLISAQQYEVPESSPLRSSGLDLEKLFGIETGGYDFRQQPASPGGIGACF